MGDVGGDALAVALVQTAATLPVFLLVVPAGALGDILDRRRLLLAGQALMCAGAAAITALNAARGSGCPPGLAPRGTASIWSPSPACDGASRNPSRRPRPASVWISTSTDAGSLAPVDDPGHHRARVPRRRDDRLTFSPDGLIAVTVNERRRLFHALVIEPVRRITDIIAWSIYRRRHRIRPVFSSDNPSPRTPGDPQRLQGGSPEPLPRNAHN
jgi:hypothetical protein